MKPRGKEPHTIFAKPEASKDSNQIGVSPLGLTLASGIKRPPMSHKNGFTFMCGKGPHCLSNKS